MKKGLLALLLFAGCAKKEVAVPLPPTVKVQNPLVKTVPIFIEAVGHVQPIQSVAITPQASGQLTQLYYEEGTVATAGDILAMIDKRPYLAQKHQVEAQIAQNQASLTYAKDTLVRNAPLVKEDFISKNTFENLTTNVLTIEAQILQNFAELDNAQINLDYCTIKAPISGLLGQKLIDIGNVVTANSNQTLVTINQMDPIWINFSVPESHLPQILQQRALHALTVELYENFENPKVATGTLDFIDNTVNPETGMIVLKGIFINSDYKLWPGKFYKVRLILYEQQDAVLVSSKSIQYGRDGPYLFRINRESQAEVIPVKLGSRQGTDVVIQGGINKNDLIVVSGQVQIGPGSPVHVVVGSP